MSRSKALLKILSFCRGRFHRDSGPAGLRPRHSAVIIVIIVVIVVVIIVVIVVDVAVIVVVNVAVIVVVDVAVIVDVDFLNTPRPWSTALVCSRALL